MRPNLLVVMREKALQQLLERIKQERQRADR